MAIIPHCIQKGIDCILKWNHCWELSCCVSLCSMSALNQKLDRAFNLTSLQILRIDREGMIDNIKMHVTSFVVMSCDNFCPNILVYSKWHIYHINSSYLAAEICTNRSAINCLINVTANGMNLSITNKIFTNIWLIM